MNKKIDPTAGAKARAAAGKAAVAELSPQALQRNKDLHPAASASGNQSRAMNDVKDLGVVSGKKRGAGGANADQIDTVGAINANNTKEDSFQKLYSKELDLDEDEVPIILHELNDSAIHFISHEQYERSLSLL